MSTPKPGPRLNKENNPGKAIWCEDHKRLECKHNRSRGRGKCHGPAIRGTDVCKIHPGKRRELRIAEGEARITAWSAVGQPDGERLDAGMAVLGMLQMTWLRAAAYGELLRLQVIKEGMDPNEVLGAGDQVDATGLIGYRFGAAGKDGTIYATNEEIRALVDLEARERDRVVKFAKTAHDMGISERITNLAERWGDVVITRIMILLEALELSPEQESRVPALIQSHLGQIDLGLGSKDSDG